MDEDVARKMFQAAIREERCGEVFDALAGDGAVTIDRLTGKLVIIDGNMLAQMVSGPEWEETSD